MFPKTDTEKKFIRSALSGNLFLKALTLRIGRPHIFVRVHRSLMMNLGKPLKKTA